MAAKAILTLLVLGLAYFFVVRPALDDDSNGNPASATDRDGRPSWVESPESYFDPPRTDLWVAVGEAGKHPNPGFARKQGTADARAKLAKMIEDSRNANGSADPSTDVLLRGSQMVESWTAPDGRLCVLVTAPKNP